MSDVVKWPGRSGQVYPMTLYELPCSSEFRGDGVYILCRHVRGQWEAVLIGEGDLAERVGVAEKDRGVYRKGATHVCLGYAQGAKKERLAIVADLLSLHQEAYEPKGCNQRP